MEDSEDRTPTTVGSSTPLPPPSIPSTSNIEEHQNDGHENESDSQNPNDPQEHRQLGSRFPFSLRFFVSNFRATVFREDVLSVILIASAFWFFASLTLILGLYGNMTLQLGPNCSRLIQTNTFFVESITVKELGDHEPGIVLYGFHKPPHLDVEISWNETHAASVPVNSYKDWIFYLNKGSKVDISYTVKSSSLPLSLVIAQGEESFVDWIDDPSYPNITLSWNIIYGSGMIQQDITESSNYYIAVGNLNTEDVEIQLKFSIEAFVYNTTQSYYRCSLGDHSCSLNLGLFSTNAAVLDSPDANERTSKGNWYVKVSYGPRWITYILGSGIISIIIWLGFKTCNFFYSETRDGNDASNTRSERAPLLPEKDDDSSSWGSSYDSVSHDEADLEGWIVAEGKPPIEGEGNNPRKLCVVCFDAPRDCFFLPCGHCATCFTCGTRITEDAGTCPICRRKMKKVRKIFTV